MALKLVFEVKGTVDGSLALMGLDYDRLPGRRLLIAYKPEGNGEFLVDVLDLQSGHQKPSLRGEASEKFIIGNFGMAGRNMLICKHDTPADQWDVEEMLKMSQIVSNVLKRRQAETAGRKEKSKTSNASV